MRPHLCPQLRVRTLASPHAPAHSSSMDTEPDKRCGQNVAWCPPCTRYRYAHNGPHACPQSGPHSCPQVCTGLRRQRRRRCPTTHPFAGFACMRTGTFNASEARSQYQSTLPPDAATETSYETGPCKNCSSKREGTVAQDSPGHCNTATRSHHTKRRPGSRPRVYKAQPR